MLRFWNDNTLDDLSLFKAHGREKYPCWSGMKAQAIPFLTFLTQMIPDLDVFVFTNHFNPYTGEFIPDCISVFWGDSESFGPDAFFKVDRALTGWLTSGILYDYRQKHGEPMDPMEEHLHSFGTMCFGTELRKEHELNMSPAEYRKVILNNPAPFPYPDMWDVFKKILDETYPEEQN